MSSPARIVMVGGTGAVGGQVIQALLASQGLERLTLLGRRPVEGIDEGRVEQHLVDVLDPGSYAQHLGGHAVGICTLGVGQPSKMSKEDFLKIDRDAPLAFGQACRAAGVARFLLLGSVGSSSTSRSFYLRAKGELQDGLRQQGFEQLSLFQPSMILTPQNRYGWQQALTLKVWPVLGRLMLGPLAKYRGIPVEQLGRAMAERALRPGAQVEELHWPELQALASARGA